MKMQDILRNIADLLDQSEASVQPEPVMVAVSPQEQPGKTSPFTNTGDDVNRFRQIIDLVSDPDSGCEYSNSPDEKYADIEAVTVDAGGGINGPKHPSDIRGDHISLYPAHQHGMGE